MTFEGSIVISDIDTSSSATPLGITPEGEIVKVNATTSGVNGLLSHKLIDDNLVSGSGSIWQPLSPTGGSTFDYIDGDSEWDYNSSTTCLTYVGTRQPIVRLNTAINITRADTSFAYYNIRLRLYYAIMDVNDSIRDVMLVDEMAYMYGQGDINNVDSVYRKPIGWLHGDAMIKLNPSLEPGQVKVQPFIELLGKTLNEDWVINGYHEAHILDYKTS